MYSKQVMYCVWTVLVFLCILPSIRSSLVNKLALLIWMAIIAAVGAVQTFHELFWNGNGSMYSFSKKFGLFCYYVLVPLEANIVLYQIHQLMKQLEVDVKAWTMYPKRIWLYLLCLGFNLVWNVYINPYIYVQSELWYVVSFVLSAIIWPLPLLGADLIIGCFASQFCQQVKDSIGVESLETVNMLYVPILSQYKAAKESMEYLLLAVFSIESIQLTNSGYSIAKSPNFSYISIFLYIMLHLSYISLVLDDCCSLLKSILPRLR